MTYPEVVGSAEQDVFGGRVPFNVPHPPLVAVKVDDPLAQVRMQSVCRDLPHLHLK